MSVCLATVWLRVSARLTMHRRPFDGLLLGCVNLFEIFRYAERRRPECYFYLKRYSPQVKNFSPFTATHRKNIRVKISSNPLRRRDIPEEQGLVRTEAWVPAEKNKFPHAVRGVTVNTLASYTFRYIVIRKTRSHRFTGTHVPRGLCIPVPR